MYRNVNNNSRCPVINGNALSPEHRTAGTAPLFPLISRAGDFAGGQRARFTVPYLMSRHTGPSDARRVRWLRPLCGRFAASLRSRGPLPSCTRDNVLQCLFVLGILTCTMYDVDLITHQAQLL